MDLTVSKRFEFSASHRLRVGGWSKEKNSFYYGREAGGEYGHGHNFVAWFVFAGPVDNSTGMVVNVTTIKERIGHILDSRYDHKFLNLDTPPFDNLIPTPELLAAQLLVEAAEAFAGQSARPIVCHLADTSVSSATAYSDGRRERHHWIDFSAARRTWSPLLSDDENRRIFGIASAPAGHGHHYRMRVTFAGDVDPQTGLIHPEPDSVARLAEFRAKYDHRHLNADFDEFRKKPMTTEMLAGCFLKELQASLPVDRILLSEHDDFFVEAHTSERLLMGVSSRFHAAHRLHSPALSDDENLTVYGKCDNPHGHGHTYRVESTISGKLDPKSGTLYSLAELEQAVGNALKPWDYRHLDLETDDFTDRPSTGENIAVVLWERLGTQFGDRLERLRLWETANNRFTARKAMNRSVKEGSV